MTLDNDLTTDLLVLESHINSLFDTVKKGSTKIKDIQFFEMRLFCLNSLSDMIGYILDDNAKDIFDLDQVTLCLLDEYDEITHLLDQESFNFSENPGLILVRDKESLKANFGYIVHAYLGPFDLEHFGHFFSPYDVPPASIAIIPLYRDGKYLGTLNLGSRHRDRFSSTLTDDFVVHLGRVVGLCFENRLNIETIQRTSYIDTLTGINNRRFLEQRIGEELTRCQRGNDPLTCLFLDIDNFKSVNDKYGHQVGDKVLTAVAKTIKSQLRNNDVLARYGGEEFIALLSNINQAQGFEIAERIRRTVQSLKINVYETMIPVTLSIGLATCITDENHSLKTNEAAMRLINTADSAMSRAKSNGRNRTEFRDVILSQTLALNV